MNYVLGFAFDAEDRVALIRKTKPAWQAGKLNGLGGKIEPDEWTGAAMAREFAEECGVHIPRERWIKYAVMYTGPHIVHVFKTDVHRFPEFKDSSEGHVALYHWRHFTACGEDILPNLSWLIPLARMEGDVTAKVYYPTDPLERRA